MHRANIGRKAVSLEKAAQAIVRGMQQRQQRLYVPKRLRLLAVVHALWAGTGRVGGQGGRWRGRRG